MMDVEEVVGRIGCENEKTENSLQQIALSQEMRGLTDTLKKWLDGELVDRLMRIETKLDKVLNPESPRNLRKRPGVKFGRQDSDDQKQSNGNTSRADSQRECKSVDTPPDDSILVPGERPRDESTVLVILTTSSEEEVLDELEGGLLCDEVNKDFDEFHINGRAYTRGTPLAIATLRGHGRVVEYLYNRGASPDSTYSQVVGAAKRLVTFPSMHATVWPNRIGLLKTLVDLNTNIHATTTLNANLLWEAAWAGRHEFAEWLIDAGLNLEEAATFQDDINQKITPLHAAAMQGHATVTQLLVAAGAEVTGKNLHDQTPLEDAIEKGHHEVVRILLANGADLFHSGPISVLRSGKTEANFRPTSAWRSGVALIGGIQSGGIQSISISDNAYASKSAEKRPIDDMFSLGNDTVISSAAHGLSESAHLQHIERFDVIDIARFLMSPGSAPIHILKAIMRRHKIMYWKQNFERAFVSTGLIPRINSFNVAIGPHFMELERLFGEKKQLSKEHLTFVNALAPQLQHGRDEGRSFVPLAVYMCHIPNVHEHPVVLQALIECPVDEIFDELGAKIITELQWKKVTSMVTFIAVFQCIYLVVFCALNVLLVQGGLLRWQTDHSLYMASYFCTALWVVEALLEVGQAIGYQVNSLGRKYFLNIQNYVDIFRLLLTGYVLIRCSLFGMIVKSDWMYNVCFAYSIFFRWMKILYACRGYTRIATKILPIMKTLLDIGPFCLVLFVFIFGFFNAFFALGLTELGDSWMYLYRLNLLLDIDNSLLTAHFNASSTNSFVYQWIVRVFIMISTFVMGITLMNIFIAVLSESYATASDLAWRGFFRERAMMALDYQIMQIGVKKLFSSFWQRCIIRKTASELSLSSEEATPKAAASYLYFAVPEEIEHATGPTFTTHDFHHLHGQSFERRGLFERPPTSASFQC